MINKTIQLLTFVILTAVLISCGNAKKEKELQDRIAELEQQLAKNEPKTNSTSPTEPEVKPEGPLPVFEFSEENYDFGTITEGDVVETVFKFKNIGEAPLIIESAKASCGCTVPEYSKAPIGIGEEGSLTVKFNSKGKPGIQNKTVTITANTYPKISRLRIKANVVKAEENPS
ncbi:DUF1573 domain-containing protein [Marinoscillum sp. MHG1-6]|uniref:DUF1573 domain-containing protein n=1 Tax=Marinoscillum sp. MHG1-6 TaxID=2959627 RepID=UPI0021581BA7|nr:DUF1573 domain-containing protein [Marinoscillum sp. MHG1-6]